MKCVFLLSLLTYSVIFTLLLEEVNAKILQTDINGTPARSLFPNPTSKLSPVKDKRERILGDGIFTLGYSTRYNIGGFGGYPGFGYHGHGFGHSHAHHGHYPSHGLGYGHYDPYFSKPYNHHHNHHGSYSGGYGFNHQFHHHGGFHNHYSYPGFY